VAASEFTAERAAVTRIWNRALAGGPPMADDPA
jgi:hypothetical protein